MYDSYDIQYGLCMGYARGQDSGPNQFLTGIWSSQLALHSFDFPTSNSQWSPPRAVDDLWVSWTTQTARLVGLVFHEADWIKLHVKSPVVWTKQQSFEEDIIYKYYIYIFETWGSLHLVDLVPSGSGWMAWTRSPNRWPWPQWTTRGVWQPSFAGNTYR